MDAKVYELLNDQINKELYSAYLYLDMANFYADKGLAGFQNWFTIQAQEERDHAMLMLQYLHNNGQHVELKAIALQFLDWFVKEQGEEEMNAQDNVSKMELFGGDPKGLYMLNSELQARVYSAPSLVL